MTHLSFEDFNFEVINVENPKANVLTINKGAISFDRSIASKSVSFSKPESKQKGSVKIQSIVVRNAIKMLMKDKWNEDKRYQIEGK